MMPLRQKAIAELDGATVEGRSIKVNIADPHKGLQDHRSLLIPTAVGN